MRCYSTAGPLPNQIQPSCYRNTPRQPSPGPDDFPLAALPAPSMMSPGAQPAAGRKAAMGVTAVEAWDERWATPEGRADWLLPDPAVAALVPVLKTRGARRVLDLGCGV